ncbi:Cysteine-rich repeat secretory protein 60 [Rhynchospora pubera]|uniref:Cysteine-rich repeat secretory protein 60 n=1 Tax=Rhynchospora pubera TaxID=906938 RepID=A0AAV8GBM6_9POAL|nr:Cysteine-rich repeat secretory protein 60 [Rhynchospora pubera]
MSRITTILYLLLSLLPIFALSDDGYNAFVYAGCSLPHYDPGSLYESAVDSSLASLINSAVFTSYSNFTSPSTSLSALYQCRSDLPASVCSSCLRAAVSQLSALCPSAAGATIQLRACLIKYSNESFIGKPDTTLLYKKCGAPAASYGGDVIGMRDAALGTIQASGGAYRVGGAGYVQAESQCIGDLDTKECSDCVTVAVSQVRSACAYAGAGEVYLGKCYARYWANNGYHPSSSSSSYSHEDNNDETGKTLAIIIGLIAGVALIIVFLSFIRRAGSEKD